MTLDTVAALLIFLAGADVAVTVMLVRAARQNHEAALRERATASIVLTIAALLMALLSGAYLLDIIVPEPIGTFLLVWGVVLISVPQLVWAVLYWRGSFR